MELLCIGVSHKTAPVELRERLAFSEEAQATFLRRLSDIGETMLVSTCNRVELYAASEDPASAREHALALLAEAAGDEVRHHLYEHRGEAAALHLFRVAASLDSMVIGEPQILGQVKDSFELAQRAGSARGGRPAFPSKSWRRNRPEPSAFPGGCRADWLCRRPNGRQCTFVWLETMVRRPDIPYEVGVLRQIGRLRKLDGKWISTPPA